MLWRFLPTVHFRSGVRISANDFRRCVKRAAAEGRQQVLAVVDVGQPEIRDLQKIAIEVSCGVGYGLHTTVSSQTERFKLVLPQASQLSILYGKLSSVAPQRASDQIDKRKKAQLPAGIKPRTSQSEVLCATSAQMTQNCFSPNSPGLDSRHSQ